MQGLRTDSPLLVIDQCLTALHTINALPTSLQTSLQVTTLWAGCTIHRALVKRTQDAGHEQRQGLHKLHAAVIWPHILPSAASCLQARSLEPQAAHPPDWAGMAARLSTADEQHAS